MHTFVYGSFTYKYKLITENRKTLSLTVMPNMNLVVKCPHKTEQEKIEIFLKKKWFWLQRQLNFFKKFQKKVYKKEYLSGESFLYLGRQYQLIIKKSKEDRVVLHNGRLVFWTTGSVSDGIHSRIHIQTWYTKRAREIFNERYGEIWSKFDYKCKPRLELRRMQKRWGSYTQEKSIILNPLLIHASKDCIDYVIIHELCHIKYKNHNKNFYKLLTSHCPKWEKIKEKLELRLAFLEG